MFQCVRHGLTCQLLCGIHYLFQVDVANLSILAARCESPSCHAYYQLTFSTVRYPLFQTVLMIIADIHGTILRYLPWNVCIKLYLRIGEAKNPGPTTQPQPTSQQTQPDSNRHMSQTVQFATANVVSMVDKAPWFNSFDHE